MDRIYIFKSGITVGVPHDEYLTPAEICKYENAYGKLTIVKHGNMLVRAEED